MKTYVKKVPEINNGCTGCHLEEKYSSKKCLELQAKYKFSCTAEKVILQKTDNPIIKEIEEAYRNDLFRTMRKEIARLRGERDYYIKLCESKNNIIKRLK